MKLLRLICAVLFLAAGLNAAENCGDLPIPDIADDLSRLEREDEAGLKNLANLLGGHSPGCEGWDALWKAIPGAGDSKEARLKAVQLLGLLGSKGYLGCKDCLYELWKDSDTEVSIAAEKAALSIDSGLVRLWQHKDGPAAEKAPNGWAAGPFLFVSPDEDAFVALALGLSGAPAGSASAVLSISGYRAESALVLPFSAWHLSAAKDLELSLATTTLQLEAKGAAFAMLTQNATVALLLEEADLPFGSRGVSVAFFDAAGKPVTAGYEALTVGVQSDLLDAAALDMLAGRLATESAKHLGLYSWRFEALDLEGDNQPELVTRWRDVRGSKIATRGSLALKKTAAGWQTMLDLNQDAELKALSISGKIFVVASCQPGLSEDRHMVWLWENGKASEVFSAPAGDAGKDHEKTVAYFVRPGKEQIEIYRRLFAPGAGIQKGPHDGWGDPLLTRSQARWDGESRAFVQGPFEGIPDDERISLEKEPGLGNFILQVD